MKSHLAVCSLAFMVAAFSAGSEEPVTHLAPETKAGLLERAARWQVPQPAKGSTLVKYWVYKSSRDFYALGFTEPGKPGTALVAFDNWDTTRGTEVLPVPDPANLPLKDIAPSSPFSEPNGVNFGLITGIQLLRAGHEGLGVALIEKSLTGEAGHGRSPFHVPANEAPVLMLARSCLAAAVNDITSARPDFAAIKQRIERLLADQPTLESPATRSVMEGLAESVAHQPAAAGSIERIIDDYLLEGGSHGAMNFRPDRLPAGERALILKGFEAVPALLKQLESKRFTNHLMQGFNNFPSYPMSAGQVVEDYLRRLANDEFESNWLRRQKGTAASTEAVAAWWRKAAAQGEKAYVTEHMIATDNGKTRLSAELLLIARDRYPTVIPGIYQSLLTTDFVTWDLAEALEQSAGIPPEQKIALFESAIAGNRQAHRNRALSALRTLQPDLADERLVRILNNAPKTAEREYWLDQDASLGRLVSESTSPAVWLALHKLLDRADLGMRMELIDHLTPPAAAPPEVIRSFYRVYDRYWNAREIRDVSSSKKFSGPGAGYPFDRIALRDFVHYHWAKWLGMKLDRPPEGAPAKWQAYREQVRQEIQKRRIEPPEEK